MIIAQWDSAARVWAGRLMGDGDVIEIYPAA